MLLSVGCCNLSEMIVHLGISQAMLLSVGCLTSQQPPGWIYPDNCRCCHTEIEVADQTCYPNQSQYTDTGRTSSSSDPITLGAWQGSHWSANFSVTGMTRPGKIPKSKAGIEARIFRTRSGRLTHKANEAVRTTMQAPFFFSIVVPPRYPLILCTQQPLSQLSQVTASLAYWLRRPPREWKDIIRGSNPVCLGIFQGRVILVTY